MQVVIDIPEEFEKHFNDDNFKDSFERIKADINYTGLLSGNYEIETLDMLIKAFKECKPLPKIKALAQEEPVLDKVRKEVEQLRLHKAQYITSNNKVCIDSQSVLDIIDRYKIDKEEDKEENEEVGR